jgi:hypothetical protein
MKYIHWKYLGILSFAIFFNSCATEKAQYGKIAKSYQTILPNIEKSIAYSLFLVGDAGNSEEKASSELLHQLQYKLEKAEENSSLIFLGDNIYPSGMPKSKNENRIDAEKKLDNQLEISKNFKGQTFFIPGNHDWYSGGIIGLKAQQDYLIQKTGNKNIFLPKNQCGIETKKIGEDIAIIFVDSQWFLADWDKNPEINDKCDIKTREDFFSEFEDQLNKNQNRTIIIAVHHPLLDNGSHGGQYSWEKQIFPFENKIPLPGIASFVNILRTTGGFSSQDLNSIGYRTLSNRLKTLLADKNNVIVVSGHDHNLQYIQNGNLRQIISGAGSKHEAAGIKGDTDFSFGNKGYAQLDIYTDGTAKVAYFTRENNAEKLVFQTDVLKKSLYKTPKFSDNYPPQTEASVYDKSLTEKSSFHEFVWGKNYRKDYSTLVKVPTLDLDTLFGGAKPVRKGGGHQTNSLRLNTPKGDFVLRAVKKSGSRFLQSVAFKNIYIADEINGSFADNFLLDFYTSSHPYTSLAIAELSNAAEIPHTDPKLVYLPKQKSLDIYNENFGDELYFLEKRPAEAGDDFGKVLSTDEVLKLLAKDEKYQMDESSYIKARLFDMWIGDWDRHQDQWKFSQKEIDGKIYFSAIPKDRDQAFAKYDGVLTSFILKSPALKHMQSFGADIKNIKWFNREPYPLDLALTKQSTLEDWKKQVEFLQKNLTNSVIEKSFESIPKELQNSEIANIKKYLKERKGKLNLFAEQYYAVLQKLVPITGTNKKEKFVINRLPNNDTKVEIFRSKKNGEELFFSKTYLAKQTQEIWLYGLEGEDEFTIHGKSKNPIQLRLVGGANHDTFVNNSQQKINIYDFETKENSISGNPASVLLSDDYSLNVYDYRKPYFSFFNLLPNAGFNPDDGLTLGAIGIFTINGFKRNPFTAKHTLKANLLTKSGGYELSYSGVFPKMTGNWFYQLNGVFSSSKFIRNYFGYGNETIQDKKYEDTNFYRVRAQDVQVAPSINWKKNAALFSGKLIYESTKIEKSPDRLITLSNSVDPEVFDTEHFGGVDLLFQYNNLNNKVIPTLGMKFDLHFSFLQNLNSKNQVPAFDIGLGLMHYLTKNEKITFSTYAKVKWLLSNEFVFYQMPTLGGNETLRGFKFDRFYGKSSFYQSSDVRWDIGTIRNSFFPLNIGVFGGFDYGRVWLPGEISNIWHTSVGGGVALDVLEQIGLQTSYFHSKDGGRFVVGFGLNF